MADDLPADFGTLRRLIEAQEGDLEWLRSFPEGPGPAPGYPMAYVPEEDMPEHLPEQQAETQGQSAGEMGSSGEGDDSPPRPAKREKGAKRNVRVPDKGARPPPGIDISIREICAFCPTWFNLPNVIVRAYRNGWDRYSLANAVALATGNLDDDGFLKRSSEALQQNVSKGGKLYLGKTQNDRFDKTDLAALGHDNDMTATNWQYREFYAVPLGWTEYTKTTKTKDVPLRKFWQKAANWPAGEDRLLFSEILEYDRQNPQMNLTTADYGQILQQLQHVAVPPAPGNRDVASLTRLDGELAVYYSQ